MATFICEKCLFTKTSNFPSSNLLHALKLCAIVLVLSNSCNGFDLPSLFGLQLPSLFGVELPCHFFDSINITDGTLHPNKSITFDGIEFPPDQYAKVNHYLDNELERQIVKPYVRGCVCNIRSCIRLCCPFGSLVDEMSADESVKCHENEAAKPFMSNRTIREALNVMSDYQVNININSTEFNQQFAYIERVCFENSIFHDDLILHDVEALKPRSKQRDYCLRVSKNENNDTTLEVMMCKDQPKKLHLRYSVLPYREFNQ